MAARIADLEEKLEDSDKWGNGKEREYHEKILQACADTGMPAYCHDADRWIRTRFERKYPEILDTVQRQLEAAIGSIEKEKKAASEKRKHRQSLNMEQICFMQIHIKEVVAYHEKSKKYKACNASGRRNGNFESRGRRNNQRSQKAQTQHSERK